MNLSSGRFKQLSNTFSCHTCHSRTMKLPVISAQYCKCMLGCEECADIWFGTGQGSKTCPLCRAERAYTKTCRLNELDSFISTICLLLATDEEKSGQPDDNRDDNFSPPAVNFWNRYVQMQDSKWYTLPLQMLSTYVMIACVPLYLTALYVNLKVQK